MTPSHRGQKVLYVSKIRMSGGRPCHTSRASGRLAAQAIRSLTCRLCWLCWLCWLCRGGKEGEPQCRAPLISAPVGTSGCTTDNAHLNNRPTKHCHVIQKA